MPHRALDATVTAPQAAPLFLAKVNPPGKPSSVVFSGCFCHRCRQGYRIDRLGARYTPRLADRWARHARVVPD
jgi:hypothetical protein